MARATFRQGKKGVDDALWWFVKLNLILAFMNLLPIPVLDGGFILMSLIEAVIRRPVPARVMAPIYTACAVLLILLMLAISFNDILRSLF